MIIAPARFLEALPYSHTRVNRVTIDGLIVPLASGSLSQDRKRNARRTATMNIALDPAGAVSASSITTASSCTIEAGLKYLNGDTDYMTIATLRVQSVRKTMKSTQLALTLADAGQEVDDYPLIYSWSPTAPGGGAQLTVVAAIQYLVEEPIGAQTWAIDLDPALLAQTVPDGTVYSAGSSRWANINLLATSLGAEVYPDAVGAWHIQQIRPVYLPVYDMATGPLGVLVDVSEEAKRSDSYNAVAIEWGTPDVPGGTVLVVDDDPASPTYWNGPWGKRPKPTMKVAVETESAAIAAGKAELAKVKGVQSGLDVQALYNPLLEINDVVGVTQSNVARRMHVLDNIEMNLASAIMQMKTRVVS